MRALITGITGQDGSYLAELLLEKGYEVHGIIRRQSTFGTERIDHIYQDPHVRDRRLFLHYGDMTDGSALQSLLELIRPVQIYHLAAQSHVGVSFEQPIYTDNVVALGTLRLLEAVKNVCPYARYYQASTSEMYGNTPAPQSEATPMLPANPYAVAKLAAHRYAGLYREAHGMHISCGILFNHESPRRGETFLTRKVTRAVGRIKHGLQKKLYVGNTDAVRDWGYAPEYVEAMWMMLQQDSPDDYVIATGVPWTVRRFIETAFEMAGLAYEDHVEVDMRYVRPSETCHLCGNPAKAQGSLKWQAETHTEQLVRVMLSHDMELARKEATWKGLEGPEFGLPAGADSSGGI